MASASPKRRPTQASDLLAFGEHALLTYSAVLEEKPDYAAWCVATMETENTCRALRRFAKWVLDETSCDVDHQMTDGQGTAKADRPMPFMPAGNQAVREINGFWTGAVQVLKGSVLTAKFPPATALVNQITDSVKGRRCTHCTPAHWNSGQRIDYCPLHEFDQSTDASTFEFRVIEGGCRVIFIETVNFARDGLVSLARTIRDPILLIPPRGNIRARQHVAVSSQSNHTFQTSDKELVIARSLLARVPSEHPFNTYGFTVARDVDSEEYEHVMVIATFINAEATAVIGDIDSGGLLAADRVTIERILARISAGQTGETEDHSDEEELVLVDPAPSPTSTRDELLARIRAARATAAARRR
jgi:hypothetical protein